MPRVRINRTEYARKDFQAWIRQTMKDKKVRMSDLANIYKVSQPAISYKLKNMAFTYDELVKLFEILGCEPERLVYFMTGNAL